MWNFRFLHALGEILRFFSLIHKITFYFEIKNNNSEVKILFNSDSFSVTSMLVGSFFVRKAQSWRGLILEWRIIFFQLYTNNFTILKISILNKK